MAIMAVWKPVGLTSHDVIDQLRRLTGEQRIGHAGTLDPLAEGVLVVGIGRASTKELSAIVHKDKEYLATIRLGATSVTDDAEGPITEQRVTQIPDVTAIKQTLQQFVGNITQQPPAYSAIKVRGRPAHRRLRAGQMVELKPRPVMIHALELMDYRWPDLKVRVVTGPGVYIRALARDLGGMLNVGGYLAALTRTRVGQFTSDQAQPLDRFRLPNE